MSSAEYQQLTLESGRTSKDEVVSLHKAGLGYKRIANRVAWSESKTQFFLLRNGYFDESRCDMDDIQELGENVRELYEETPMTFSEVCDELDCSPNYAKGAYKYVTDRIGEETIQREGQLHKLTQKKIHSADIQFATYDGYERVNGVQWSQVTRRPNCDQKEQALVHRLVAVAEYGFEAVCDSHVHHKNGIPWDNRPSNLEVVSEKHHTNKHWHKDGLLSQIADSSDQEVSVALANAGYYEAAEAISTQEEEVSA
jgi:hypothetical protein